MTDILTTARECGAVSLTFVAKPLEDSQDGVALHPAALATFAERIRAEMWQPIETAPIKQFDKEKWFEPHSPQLLVFDGFFHQIAAYGYTAKGKGRWSGRFGIIEPTHWMPLPPPPVAAIRAAGEKQP